MSSSTSASGGSGAAAERSCCTRSYRNCGTIRRSVGDRKGQDCLTSSRRSTRTTCSSRHKGKARLKAHECGGKWGGGLNTFGAMRWTRSVAFRDRKIVVSLINFSMYLWSSHVLKRRLAWCILFGDHVNGGYDGAQRPLGRSLPGASVHRLVVNMLQELICLVSLNIICPFIIRFSAY